VARFALDLTWADKRAESEGVSRSKGAYPSPPMSGSPPLPPEASQEAGDRSRVPGPYRTAGQAHDVYGSTQSHSLLPPPEDARPPPPVPATLPPPPPHPPSMRPYQQHPIPDSSDRMGYYRQHDDALARGYSYPPPGSHSAAPPAPYPPSMQGPPPPSQTQYAPTTQSQPATTTPYGSPKPSRKAKGHVPSACVPCKRAHLR
jgi:hypothetical protein